MPSNSEEFTLGDHAVAPGQRQRCQLRVARLPTDTWLSLPVEVVNGATSGPALWLTAAVHGDEVNGVEIISRVLAQIDPAALRGTLVAVPIVNVFGFIGQQRYLPDRRDLNRSFPGTMKGSLASRLARLLADEIVARCTHGIDLHTGSHHRTNLPQIRADLEEPETLKLARAFGCQVMIDARTRDGSLRRTAADRGNKVLLFEGGEALRFNEEAIEAGTLGVLRVMGALNMIEGGPPPPERPTQLVRKSKWLRAKRAGILHLRAELGDRVAKGAELGVINDTFGRRVSTVRARRSGTVIGQTLNPLVTQGDALIHIGLEDPTETPLPEPVASSGH
ncbi:MAG: succinylglutamate desuccinylase/aspartoacylase family protein [Polyangiaceae bacterium]